VLRKSNIFSNSRKYDEDDARLLFKSADVLQSGWGWGAGVATVEAPAVRGAQSSSTVLVPGTTSTAVLVLVLVAVLALVLSSTSAPLVTVQRTSIVQVVPVSVQCTRISTSTS
jgi:hypothetical protein